MSKRVLIVDDSIVVRMTLKTILSGAGYGVIEAANGQDALEKGQQTPIDLIICDVNMPVMDGLTFARLIKEEVHYRFVPIIMLTTVRGASEMESLKSAGANVWMVKPFEKEKLLNTVSKLLA